MEKLQYSIKEAAQMLSISTKQLNRYIDSGKIEAYAIDKKRFIDGDELRKFIKNNKKVGKQEVPTQIKSKKRVAEKGEVFTKAREVTAMLDLIGRETYEYNTRFLEPACGDGNFLIEILSRKIEGMPKEIDEEKAKQEEAKAERLGIDKNDMNYPVVRTLDGHIYHSIHSDKNSKKSYYYLEKDHKRGLWKDCKTRLDFEIKLLLSIGSIYGIEIMEDNRNECISRLVDYISMIYDKIIKSKKWDNSNREIIIEEAKWILEQNIVWGDGLTMTKMKTNDEHSDDPIVFSEWTLLDGDKISRKDFKFSELSKEEIDQEYTPFEKKHYLHIKEAEEIK